MKRTKAVTVCGVFPYFSTAGFLVEVDCPSNQVSGMNIIVVAMAAAKTVHDKNSLTLIHTSSKALGIVLVFNFEQKHRVCVSVNLIDRDVHLAWKIGICANQTLGSLPSGLGLARTHSQTQK